MTVPISLEGALPTSGEVTNITVGADNPQGVLFLSGEVFIDTDTSTKLLEGSITPVGSLDTLKIGQGCFDTVYDECVEGTPTEMDCIGSCEEVTLPPQPPCPDCPECPEPCPPCPEPCPPCPECPECPPVVVSDCDEILRIVKSKVIAWHIVTCGVIGASSEGGVVVTDDLEYEEQAEAEAAGWVFEDTLGDSSIIVGETAPVHSGSRCFHFDMNGDGSLAGGGYIRATRIFGAGHGLIAGEQYEGSVWGRCNTRSSFDAQKRLIVIGTTSLDDKLSNASIGAFEFLHRTVESTPGATVTVQLMCQHSFVRQVRDIWFDLVEIRGPSSGVTQWNDMSGRLNHLVAPAGNRPQLIGTLLEGHNTMAFNNAYMEWPANMLEGITTLEAFLVVKTTSGSGLWRLGGDAAADTLFFDTVSGSILDNVASDARLDFGVPVTDIETTFAIYSIRAVGTATEIAARLNNIVQAGPIGHTRAFSSAPTFGRSGPSTPGNFEVAEIVLTTELTETERFETLNVLSRRWGIVL